MVVIVDNKLGNIEAEQYIRKELESLSEMLIADRKYEANLSLKHMKSIFNDIKDRNDGIGPLAFFVKMNKNGEKYKEFNKIKFLYDSWLMKIDMNRYKKK